MLFSMFGMGENKTSESTQSDISVSVMPTEFYGGKNPTVTFKMVTKEVPFGGLSPAEKKSFDQATAVGSGQAMHPATLFTSRRFIFIIGGVLFVLFTGAVSWYYIRQATPESATLPPNVPVVQVPPVVEAPAVVSTTTIEEASAINPEVSTTIPAAPVSLVGGGLEFPSLVLGGGQDFDNDGLTDPEEELFKTDPGTMDTDNDSYTDSSEVFHLYNPIGKEPQKLNESQLVQEFVNPVVNYRLYYPTTWAVGAVDQNYHDMLFSTLTGENIEVKVFDNESGQSFADWFSANAPNEQLGTLNNYTNIFKESGFRRPDNLVFYFPRLKQVVVFVYHPAPGATIINYRSVLTMMAQSFRLFGNGSQIPNPTPNVIFDTTTTVVDGLSATTTGF